MYGSREQFLQTFHFSQQERHTKPEAVERCYFGKAPTLCEANLTYGEGTAEFWLVLQLTDLSEFCGCREKMNDYQLRQTALLILSTYHYLKVTELELFFRRFKLGLYGQFYGAVDPMVITRSLRQFMRERSDAIDKHEAQLRRQQQEESSRGNHVSLENWLPERNLFAYIFWRFEGRLRGEPRPIVCGRTIGSNDKPRHIFQVDEDWSELKGRIRT